MSKSQFSACILTTAKLLGLFWLSFSCEGTSRFRGSFQEEEFHWLPNCDVFIEYTRHCMEKENTILDSRGSPLIASKLANQQIKKKIWIIRLPRSTSQGSLVEAFEYGFLGCSKKASEIHIVGPCSIALFLAVVEIGADSYTETLKLLTGSALLHAGQDLLW